MPFNAQFEERRRGAEEQARGDKELRRYLASLTPAERERYLRGRQEVMAPPAPPPDPLQPMRQAVQQGIQQAFQQGPQEAPRQAFSPPVVRRAPSAQSAFVEEFGPVAQGTHLQGMIAGVQKAYRDENRSRVEQAAAQQERDFEMEKERLRQESLLRRLAIEQEEREKDRILQKQLATGVTSRRLVNGRWVDV